MYDTVRYGTSIEYNADLSHSAHTVQLHSLLDDQYHEAVQITDLKNSSEVGHCLCLLLENHIRSTSLRNMLQHITSHHITPQHITIHHITTHHITSHHNTTHHNTTQHIISYHITIQCNTSQQNTSQHITSQHIATQHISSHRIK
jgi:hypothetical protein